MESLQEEEGGEACFFSHGPDLVFRLVTLAPNAPPLHTKGQEDKSQSTFVTRPIHHSK